MPGLLIGVPTLGRPVTLEWAYSFKSLNPPINYNTVFSTIYGKPVAIARNIIAEEAIKQNCKYLLFIGDDTIVPAHALRQFIFRMENDPMVGVVGGVYFSKSDPPSPLVFKGNGEGAYWDWKLGEYFPVTGLGMDATMIRVELLLELAKEGNREFFKTVDQESFLDNINYAEMWTEDLYFLNRVAKETQFKIMCDAGIIAKHVDVHTGKIYTLPSYSLPTRRFQGEGKKIIDIGCGHTYREFEEGIPVRVDLDETCNPDYRADVRNLPFGNQEFDIVFSSHVLEHFSRVQQEIVLKEWIRILKPDGELRLILPNIMWAAKKLVEDDYVRPDQNVWNVLYGGQSNELDFHYNGFTPRILNHILASAGLEIIHQSESGYNLITHAKFRKLEEDSGLRTTS